jgi:superfamily II DNA or RNA helicase
MMKEVKFFTLGSQAGRTYYRFVMIRKESLCRSFARSTGRLAELGWHTSGESNLAKDFYAPSIATAIKYDRAAGFFSSSVFDLVKPEISGFAARRGKMRLICSPRVSENDWEAISDGYRRRFESTMQERDAVLREIALAPSTTHLLRLLVASGVLDVKIATTTTPNGMFHSKVAIFTAANGRRIASIGSANESAKAFSKVGNHEAIATFRSWESPEERERVQAVATYFESLWSGREQDLVVKPFFGLGRQERYVDLEEELRERGEPRMSYELRPHQLAILSSWHRSGHAGIVTHATGSGKTITALAIIRDWIKEGRPALVLVPSELLSHQWYKVAQEVLCDLDPRFLVVGGSKSDHDWEASLADFTRSDLHLGPRLTISTVQTAASDRFLSRVVHGEQLLVVADEVHRLGSPAYQKCMTISAGGRLGLSATPRRYGDPEGTSAIRSYFADDLAPTFTLKDGIKTGALVPYEYWTHEVSLTDSEQTAWDDATTKIKKAYALLPDDTAGGGKEFTFQFKMLLIKRASLIKNAEGKVALATSILSREYQVGDRWLVYCDNQQQLKAVIGSLKPLHLPVFEYHSAMPGSRRASMEHFSRRGGILVAIRCLDEGVDIPEVNKALVLASSANPREFIQRRGRLLRPATEKPMAVIHDVLTVPSPVTSQKDEGIAIHRVELTRAFQFAQNAINRSVSHTLQRKARQLGLSDLAGAVAEFEDDG